MYALRFFIGLFESCAFPGYIAMLGSWYGPNELTKRLAILLEVESIASMFSGYLQAGLYSSMNGRHGLAGWRWLFIMDGVISVPVAIWGLFGLPDHPHNTRAFYWTKEVSQLSRKPDKSTYHFSAYQVWPGADCQVRRQRAGQTELG